MNWWVFNLFISIFDKTISVIFFRLDDPFKKTKRKNTKWANSLTTRRKWRACVQRWGARGERRRPTPWGYGADRAVPLRRRRRRSENRLGARCPSPRMRAPSLTAGGRRLVALGRGPAPPRSPSLRFEYPRHDGNRTNLRYSTATIHHRRQKLGCIFFSSSLSEKGWTDPGILLSFFATFWVLLLSVGFRIRGIKKTDEDLLPFFL